VFVRVGQLSDEPRAVATLERMIRSTIVRIGELVLRYGHLTQLAPLDRTSSRRSSVMCALPRATAVTTVYQGDSSSKRPRSSVVSAARAPTRRRSHEPDTASRASRPTGAFGAPGPRDWLVSQRIYHRQAMLGGTRQASCETTELDKGSFHISSSRRRSGGIARFSHLEHRKYLTGLDTRDWTRSHPSRKHTCRRVRFARARCFAPATTRTLGRAAIAARGRSSDGRNGHATTEA
jgi:hypothetical protein